MQNGETRAQKHLRISQQFLDAADEPFEEGDIIQTSEKLWGATVHAVKYLCIRRRWRHNNYTYLRNAIKSLGEETGETTLTRDFSVAQGNHINFYEDFMTAEAADEHRQVVRELVVKVLAAANSPLPKNDA